MKKYSIHSKCIWFSDGQTCNITHFSCTQGIIKCIPKLWVCDGQQECADGSDESGKICDNGKDLEVS